MKAITIAILALCIVAVSCRPDKAEIQRLKQEGKRRQACLSDCTTEQYQPVCAGKQGQKPKSFGNQCALNNHNCEHKDNLQKVSDGPCPGSDGIRL